MVWMMFAKAALSFSESVPSNAEPPVVFCAKLFILCSASEPV